MVQVRVVLTEARDEPMTVPTSGGLVGVCYAPREMGVCECGMCES